MPERFKVSKTEPDLADKYDGAADGNDYTANGIKSDAEIDIESTGHLLEDHDEQGKRLHIKYCLYLLKENPI